ncbi:MAG: SM-20-related protein [Pseudohongiellaceae bacterium]|jgi:SM-20-related protein
MNNATDLLLGPITPSDDLFETITRDLEAKGYVYLPSALPQSVTDSLLDYLGQLEHQKFHEARTGRGRGKIRNRFVRRDRIHWIDETNPAAASWLDWSQQLQAYLNRHLFLGLFSFESHFSHYRAGDFYRKHLDAFKGKSNRVLSLVVYLNRGWEPDHGGELVIYSPEDGSDLVKVTPGLATLVLFLSEDFEHEVLPTNRDRYTVAGWFRRQGNLIKAVI